LNCFEIEYLLSLLIVVDKTIYKYVPNCFKQTIISHQQITLTQLLNQNNYFLVQKGSLIMPNN